MMVGEAEGWVERTVEIRKVKSRGRCSQPGSCLFLYHCFDPSGFHRSH
jgi:hypothetical protein